MSASWSAWAAWPNRAAAASAKEIRDSLRMGRFLVGVGKVQGFDGPGESGAAGLDLLDGGCERQAQVRWQPIGRAIDGGDAGDIGEVHHDVDVTGKLAAGWRRGTDQAGHGSEHVERAVGRR